MSRSAHTEAQIIAAVKQVEAGRKTEEVAREMGVSKHTIYAWKQKYGGMDVSEAQEVKALRDENARLKRLVAELSLDKDALQFVIRKNVWSAAGLQLEKWMKKVCVNVSGLFGGQKALATMRMRAHPSS